MSNESRVMSIEHFEKDTFYPGITPVEFFSDGTTRFVDGTLRDQDGSPIIGGFRKGDVYVIEHRSDGTQVMSDGSIVETSGDVR